MPTTTLRIWRGQDGTGGFQDYPTEVSEGIDNRLLLSCRSVTGQEKVDRQQLGIDPAAKVRTLCAQ